jgi:hypothetical protein
MAQRHAARSQVRPRPPSTGRPAPERKQPRPSSGYRVTSHRPIDRGPGLPLIVRGLLVVAIVALGAVVLYTATGELGKAVAGIGTNLTRAVNSITSGSSAAPSGSAVAPDSPNLDQPANAYTNEATVDISGTVPLSVLGSKDDTITLFQALSGQDPVPVRDGVAIPPTANFTIPGVRLVKGTNVFTAVIVDASGTESKKSKSVSYVLDTSKPKLTITSPKNSSTVNGISIQVKGRTQANSTILAVNATNHATGSATADKNGAFTVRIAVAKGANTINITSTDPATNATSTTVRVTRGAGKLSLGLTANHYSFSAKSGSVLRFTALLVDPDGHPIPGQTVVFTISIAGVPTDVRQATTDGSGKATVTMTIGPHAANSGRNHTGIVVASAQTHFGHIQKSIAVTTRA